MLHSTLEKFKNTTLRFGKTHIKITEYDIATKGIAKVILLVSFIARDSGVDIRLRSTPSKKEWIIKDPNRVSNSLGLEFLSQMVRYLNPIGRPGQALAFRYTDEMG